MTDITHKTLLTEAREENAKLLDLLIRAREMMAGSTVYLQALEDHAPHLEGARVKRLQLEAFLAAGLFGDKGTDHAKKA